MSEDKPGLSNEELKPYTVEVDDHSDDCGTVYRLKGPNVSILSKDEELLKERAEDFNLGFEMGRRSQEAPVAQVEVYRKALEEAIRDLEHYGPPPPDHQCTPGITACDGLCMDFASFSKTMDGYRKALLTSKPEPVAPVRKWEAEEEK